MSAKSSDEHARATIEEVFGKTNDFGDVDHDEYVKWVVLEGEGDDHLARLKAAGLVKDETMFFLTE